MQSGCGAAVKTAVQCTFLIYNELFSILWLNVAARNLFLGRAFRDMSRIA